MTSAAESAGAPAASGEPTRRGAPGAIERGAFDRRSPLLAGSPDAAGAAHSAVEGSVPPPRAWLVAGAGGMLGTALQRVIAESGDTLCAPGEGEFDITDPVAVRRRVAEFAEKLAPAQRGVLVNAAAFTNVEAAEDPANEELAYLVNAQGPAILARAARDADVAFVHVSTDFVFDGRKDGAYAEDDDTNPLSVYGASKLLGELAVVQELPEALVVRTAWVFGSGGANFPLKIISAARDARREARALKVVTDEVGSPTYTVDLARGMRGLVEAGARGLFHLAGSGSCSRFELAQETLSLAGLGDVGLEPVPSSAFPSKAARPANSVLDCAKAAALGVEMPDWRDALARFLGEVGELAG
jgi:dTDP-4-dehydrorhamnose reductase